MWVVVPNLNEAKDQLDHKFPNRDKSSDGSIGDLAHQVSTSSHNPDLTGRSEFHDGDSIDEVRARDFDKDLNDPSSITMEQVVQLWVKLARSGSGLWWVRYIIFNRRIWQRSDNFVTHVYTGSNPHDKHVHVNSDYNQAADTVTNTNWHLNDLSAPPPPAPPAPTGPRLRMPWPSYMPTNHYFGLISGPTQSHGGYYAQERPAVQEIQRRLIVLGYVPGITKPSSGWADGKFEQATKDAVARWQRAKYSSSTSRYGEIWIDDWKHLFTY